MDIVDVKKLPKNRKASKWKKRSKCRNIDLPCVPDNVKETGLTCDSKKCENASDNHQNSRKRNLDNEPTAHYVNYTVGNPVTRSETVVQIHDVPFTYMTMQKSQHHATDDLYV